jgi:predicted DNA-binding transcriptional regulator YafY
VRASRLVALLLLLQARGRMSAAGLAAELEVSVRTIQRDVEALAAAGVPVYSERGRDGGYRLIDGYRSRLTGLSREEAEALVAFGAAGAGPARELGLGEALMSARLKLAASLPVGLREDIAAAAGRFHLDAPGWFSPHVHPPCLEAIAAGVFGDLVIEARYRGGFGAGGRVRDCLLEPLGLVLKAGRWYVVARQTEGGQIRGYRADRFESALVSSRPFTRPEGFDLAAFWAAWSAEFERSLPVVWVSVRARADRVPRLRRVAEPGRLGEVDWAAAPDTGGWVRLLLPFEKLGYARASLLGFGADVEVLAPQELREQIAADAAGLAGLYGPATA